MKRTLVFTVTLFALSACGEGGGEGDAQAAADTLTRAQKDSIVAELPIPGAGAVGSAMKARDAANARVEAHDTIR